MRLMNAPAAPGIRGSPPPLDGGGAHGGEGGHPLAGHSSQLFIRRCAGSSRPSSRRDRAVTGAPGPPGPGWYLGLGPGPSGHLCQCFSRLGDLQDGQPLFPADTERLNEKSPQEAALPLLVSSLLGGSPTAWAVGA